MSTPSFEHGRMVILFRECPQLAVQLLRSQPGVSLARAVHAVDGSAEFGPTESVAHPVVAVVELFGADASRPVQAIVVEVAVRVGPAELASWRAHVARVHAELGCPVCLLVVAERARLAERARQPLEIGPGWSLTPVVVGPDEMPAVTDLEQARRAPEFAALSAILHGRDRDVKRAAAITLAATEAKLVFDRSRWMAYRIMLAASMSRRASEELLTMRFEAHRRRGRTRHKAYAEAVLEVLDARGLAVSMADRQRILALPELATLRTWLRRAAVAERTSDVFAK